jgi:predicted Fe-Mo cluster-binding NifX family protein
MKIAIAATEDDADSRIHQTFGKSPYFIVYDSTTGALTSIRNPVQTSEASTGVEVARILVDRRIDKVVGGMFGERVQRVFLGAGIQMEAAGDKTVNEYVSSLSNPVAGKKSPPLPSTQANPPQNDPARIERGSCYCSTCGYSTTEETEAPCFQRYCPDCKTPLERKF